MFQSLQQVRDVLQTGADVNETRISGHTALWFACNRGQPEVTRALLDAGASPGIPDSLQGYTPLHFLSRFDPDRISEVARWLIASGAEVEALNNAEETPLMTVLDDERNFVPYTTVPAVKALLALGASPYGQIRDDHVLGDSRVIYFPDCPIVRACVRGEPEALTTLIDHIKELRSLKQRGDQESGGQAARGPDGSAPAPSAEMDEYLAALMARFFFLTICRPVLYRVGQGREYKHSVRQLTKYLLVPEVRSYLSENLKSALLQSCSQRAYDFVEAILEMKCYSDADLSDPKLIECVFGSRNSELVSRLWTAGMKPGGTENSGTFLHLAVTHRWTVADLSKICDLVRDKIDLSELARRHDSRGATPFASAVIQGNLGLADFLASFGVDIDEEAFRLELEASLFAAIPFGWPRCTLLGYCLVMTADDLQKLQQVRYLLKYKPKFLVSTSHGCTALTLCWRH